MAGKYEEAIKSFERLKDFDSMVFIEIPQPQIQNPRDYRTFLVEKIEWKWMEEFNKNRYYSSQIVWNDNEGGVGGYFGSEYFPSCKLYRYDGTLEPFGENDFRAKRGFLIRDHYSNTAVVKVHKIADNLLEFLRQKQINYQRINFDKDKRMPIPIV